MFIYQQIYIVYCFIISLVKHRAIDLICQKLLYFQPAGAVEEALSTAEGSSVWSETGIYTAYIFPFLSLQSHTELSWCNEERGKMFSYRNCWHQVCRTSLSYFPLFFLLLFDSAPKLGQYRSPRHTRGHLKASQEHFFWFYGGMWCLLFLGAIVHLLTSAEDSCLC